MSIPEESQESIAKFVQNDGSDLHLLAHLLKSGAVSNINAIDRSSGRIQAGCSALMFQAAFGSVEAMRFLLTQSIPALPNIQNDEGNTALHMVVLFGEGNVSKIRLLLDYGADRSIKCKEGLTALKLARDRSLVECCKLLEESTPNVKTQTENNKNMKSIIPSQQTPNPIYISPPTHPILVTLHVIFAIVARCWVAFSFGYSGFGKPPMFGDFEAQRHWLEITTNLKISDWYRQTPENDLLYWGIDYPPLTAYVSWLFGKAAEVAVPELVTLETSRGIETNNTKVFMRISVLICDYFIIIPSILWLVNHYYRLIRTNSNPLEIVFFRLSALLSPALLLIDHGHFQYNGVSIGLTLMSACAILEDYDVVGSILFSLALNYKQMILYYSLVIFIVLLGKIWRQKTLFAKFIKLVQIGSAVLITFALLWFPFCVSPPDGIALSPQSCLDSMGLVLRRCFPFSRGIFEDKVANLWYVLSVVYDFRGVVPVEVVVRASILLTLALSAPILFLLFKRNLSYERLLLGLTGGSLVFFLASYQVHEKSLLMTLVPVSLLLLAELNLGQARSSNINSAYSNVFSAEIVRCSRFCQWLQILGTWTLFPLLVKDGLRVPYFVYQALYFLVTLLVEHSSNSAPSRAKRSRASLYLPSWFNNLFFLLSYLGMAVLHIGEFFVPAPANLPDLYPALFSIFGCLNLCAAYIIILYWLITIRDDVEPDGVVAKSPASADPQGKAKTE